ncbi:MAG: quinohemoprotein ethanol dehydrogenase [Gaiellaceae bacterium]|nr:quinohemoprotein ethanol dehydrogenase [Gaiellaceae bacterium]
MAVALLLSACGTGGSVSNASSDKENGRKVFQDTCAGCHTLAAAGSQGTFGPNLDYSFAQARSEGFKESAILDIVHDQIKFAGQYPTRKNNRDFLKANMPANLVTGQDAIDVSAFVAANAGLQGFAEAQAVTGTNGKQIFITKCGGCHTLKDAGTTGTQGPNLDLLKPPFLRAKNQVIKGGGIMPAFKGVLNDAQINAVAKYVADHAGK